MIFHSFEFVFFLILVFLLYWFVAKGNTKRQNFILLAASYFFYGFWDYRFLLLLACSITLDFIVGLQIGKCVKEHHRRNWFIFSIITNLSLLGFFKYFNFFSESLAVVLKNVGFQVDTPILNIVLPIGISFYTFHELSYIIDVYKRRIEPERSYLDYSLFVTFFPLLVAGPIERATHLLPQVKNARTFCYSKAVDGLRQILWGLFKKVVIADNCAAVVNIVFDHPGAYSGSTLALAAVYFSIQIYCDFSGYSDIALGTARLFGFELLRNFSFPYFSRDIAEFWRRWHISLTTWFRDYLYIGLGGSKRGLLITVRNTFIIFLVSGLWHGANWTFIVWGALHALYFLPLLLMGKNRKNLETVAKGNRLPGVREMMSMLITFGLVTISWIFFRAENLQHATEIMKGILSRSLITRPAFASLAFLLLIAAFFVVEWLGRERKYAVESLFTDKPLAIRWAFYASIFIMIFIWHIKDQQFIYFQF